MSRPAPSFFFPLFALVACASSPEKPTPVEATAQEFFTYHATVASVPEGASNLLVSVRLPEEWPTGVLRPLQAHGLVGNAPFEHAFAELVLPSNMDFDSDVSWTEGPVSLSVNTRQKSGTRHWELGVETHGKPLELSLRLAQMTGAPIDASALEQELARGTTATVDGKPVEGLATRLERSK
ncbi:MAG: hypothetical protein EXS08_09935 [Planctomycetes bacterium]|nr:hypothetical protein [Planctomycetota bacterium]